MNTQGAVSILFSFYHLVLKTCNIKNLSVVDLFSPCIDQYAFFITKMQLKFKLSCFSQ